MHVKPNKHAARTPRRPARALVAAARPLFAAQGFAGVGTEEIVARRRGHPRRALPPLPRQGGPVRRGLRAGRGRAHAAHRRGRRRARRRSPRRAARRAPRPGSTRARSPRCTASCCSTRPAVLGRERWREIALRNGLGLVVAALQAAIDAGQIEPQPVEPLAHVLLGAIDEAALYLAGRRGPRRRARRGRRGARPPARRALAAGTCRGAPARRTPSSSGIRTSASRRRVPSGVRSSKSSSSSGISTKRRLVACAWGSVRRGEENARVAEQQHVDVDRPRAVAHAALEVAAELAPRPPCRRRAAPRARGRSRSARRR